MGLLARGAIIGTAISLHAQAQSPLPEAPSARIAAQSVSLSDKALAAAPQPNNPASLEPCLARRLRDTSPEASSAEWLHHPCPQAPRPYALFLDSPKPLPLTVQQKGRLAIHDVIDPFNLLTVVGNSAFTVGFNSHSAYGPGMKGFGRNVGYSFLQDATGEFIGTFAVCSLFHQDPHYHRMPEGKPMRRFMHALARTVIAQHDDGSRMPNYENFITYPGTALISNLYVPGVQGNGPSTVARVATGLATDPVNNLITEFLPDVAKHVHIRVVFVQQIINQVATTKEQF